MQAGKHMEYEKDLIYKNLKSKNLVTYAPPTPIKVVKPKSTVDTEKKDKEKIRELIESRKHLAALRVIQRNLVYVVGLPHRYANEEVLRNIFEQHGEISKMIIGTLPSNFSTEPLNTAYITYSNDEDAIQAICVCQLLYFSYNTFIYFFRKKQIYVLEDEALKLH